jgi:hypothetical protein
LEVFREMYNEELNEQDDIDGEDNLSDSEWLCLI